MAFNVEQVKQDFPILDQEIQGKPLVYLDNGATTQKPKAVLDALKHYYEFDNSNVHRGAHALSDRATVAFENARSTVQQFINAEQSKEIIWTRGTTESINIVAQSYGTEFIDKGDQILVSAMEHHANIVPWQMLCERKGAELKVIPVSESGELDMDAYAELLNDKVKFVSLVHVSNALGTVNPVADVIEQAHAVGAKVLIDGAQAVAHFPVDVQALDADFYVFSAHKLFGPTGVGVLYGKEALLNAMPPVQGGGEMIEKVSFNGTTFQGLPFKFEAGTPNIAGAIGLAAAIEYVNGLDREAMQAHEDDILAYAHEKAEQCEGLKLIGTAKNKAGVLSFLIEGTHPADVGMLLDQQGVAVRTGHHCAMPIMDQYQIPGTARASFSIYNTRADVDALFAAIEKVKMFLL
ncbi:cysteine desulfurase [Bermanella marisrubri]|uniref:Probable cysteine desulfurase n=1 Tax=Bermanella marisrubri TaxID=207949 RepID=Q1N0G9_9GAMM|nr:cysteine desulfurase [Bermanella marisrubri]EAT11695.1 selenocysteine lyase [Oceanobacter sp. RED65] [Bermanella marisrubri]QIZ83270.1 cysteine desulfurase [Bermanella marisrubri]